MTPAADPLTDTLFRQTVNAGPDASAAPVRAAGTHTRAGNAMSRTRSALLAGARRAVQVNGTKITMAQVAAAAGVAKATLYNHFRTRDAVLAALLAEEIDILLASVHGRALPDALKQVASGLSAHPLRRSLAGLEPGTLAGLAAIDPAAPGWQRARTAVRDALAGDGRRGTDCVLRWLASHLITPAGAAAIAADVDILLAGLPAARTPATTSEEPHDLLV
ncbi:MAG: TetR family transcriptional regulator [Actinomycetota bacterium]